MRGNFSEQLGCCLRPRCYYVSLLVGLILLSASLVGRSAAWGYISPGTLTDTNFNFNRQYEYWLNPLTLERCDLYKGGSLRWYVEIDGRFVFRTTDATGARLCYEFDYLKWQDIWRGTVLAPWLAKCYSTGITSYVFVITGMATVLAGFSMVRCCHERTGPAIQYTTTFFSICFLIIGLAAFYAGCVTSQESNLFTTFGRVRTFALGYVYAIGGMIFLLIFTCIHIYAIHITPPHFFGQNTEDDWNDNSFAQAREAARTQDGGENHPPTELYGNQNDAWTDNPSSVRMSTNQQPETNNFSTNDVTTQQTNPYSEPAAGGWDFGGGGDGGGDGGGE